MHGHLALPLAGALLLTPVLRADSPATKTPAAPVVSGYRDIPLQTGAHPGELIVPVLIDGKPARMLVDTGCSMTNLFHGALPRFGLAAKPSGKTLRTVGGLEKVDLVDIDTFRLGDDTTGDANAQKFHVRPGTHPRFDGILGTDILGKNGALIDMGRSLLRLPLAPAAARDTHAVAGKIAIPLRIKNGLPFLDATIDGVPVTLLLDTGGQQTLLDDAVAKKAGLTIHPTPARMGGGNRPGGAALGMIAPKHVTLGELRLQDLPCLTADLAAMSAAGFSGMLAGEALVRLDAVIDLGGGRLLLVATPPELCDVGVIPSRLPAARSAEKLLRDHRHIIAGRFAAAPKITPPVDGAGYGVATLTYAIDEVIPADSEHKPGDLVTVDIALPASENFMRDAPRMAHRYAAALILGVAENNAAPSPPETRLLRASPLRIDELREAAGRLADR